MKNHNLKKLAIKRITQLVGLLGGQTLHKNSNRYKKLVGKIPIQKPKIPLTTRQLKVRLKFGLVSSTCSLCMSILTVSHKFQYKKSKINARRTLFRYLYAHLVSGRYPNFKVNYPGMQLSPGRLNTFAELKYTSSINGLLDLSWLDYSYADGPTNNRADVYVFVVNETKHKSEIFPALAYPKTFTLQVQLSNYSALDKIHCWMLLRWNQHRKVSPCVYAEKIMPNTSLTN